MQSDIPRTAGIGRQGVGGRIRIAVIILFAAFLVLGLFAKGIAAAHASAISFHTNHQTNLKLNTTPITAR
jgi:hypothetical protein